MADSPMTESANAASTLTYAKLARMYEEITPILYLNFADRDHPAIRTLVEQYPMVEVHDSNAMPRGFAVFKHPHVFDPRDPLKTAEISMIQFQVEGAER